MGIVSSSETTSSHRRESPIFETGEIERQSVLGGQPLGLSAIPSLAIAREFRAGMNPRAIRF